MFCFANFDAYRLNDRNIGSTGSALMLNTGQDCGYRALDDQVHVWELAGNRATARAWRPFCSDSGRYWLFAGHLLNPDEIAAQLDFPKGRKIGDVEIYARAFDAWGDAVDDRVLGEYAVLAWDPRARMTRVVRSPFSAPPLHHTRLGRDYIISSAPRGIFGTGLIDRRIDEVKVADSLYLNYSEQERGWFENVRRVPSGVRMMINAEGDRQERYFDVADLPGVRLSDDREYVEHARYLLGEGVRRNLQGFEKPAISLSGGLDSQSVAVTALDHIPDSDPLNVYTAVPQKNWDGHQPPNRFGNEAGHVRALLDMYPRLRSHMVEAEGLSFDHNLQAMFMLAEACPRNAMNLHWIHEIRLQAKRDGCDVVLTAGRGNATFSFDGRARIPTLFRQLKWLTLFRELRAGREPDRSLFRRLLTRAMFPNLPEWAQSRLYKLVFGAPDGIPNYSALNPLWADEQDVLARAKGMGFDRYFMATRSSRRLHIILHGNENGEAGDIRQGLALVTGMPSRDPTAYRPLVEFCCGIPDDQYYRNGVSRFLAHRMMAGKLPPMVLNEKRRGAQAADWFARLTPQREHLLRELEHIERDESFARRIDVAKLRRALQDWPDHTPTGNESAAHLLQLALPRAMATNRFIRHVEGRN